MTSRTWTDRDRDDIARLLAKYGRRAVAEAAKTTPVARRAGHRRDDEARAALLDDVEWIERRAAILRSKGDRLALQSAIAERFTATRPHEQWNDAAEFKRFENRVRNVRAEHARAERAHAVARSQRRKRER